MKITEKAPAPYVVVGFTRESILSIFEKGATFSTIVGSKNLFLFNSKANPNFISFSHKLMEGGNTMSIEFIDPNQEFEKRFIMDGTFEMIAANITRSSLKPDFVDKVQLEKNIKGLEKLKGSFGAWHKALTQQQGQRKLYVTYGLGENLDTWSGPHMMTVIGAEMQVKGARKIVLKLAAAQRALDRSSRVGIFGEPIELDTGGNKLEVEGRSGIIDFKKTSGGMYEPANAPDTSIGDFPQAAKLVEKLDVHLMVTDVLRNYIQKATGSENIIILLPNINWICRRTLEDIAKVERLDGQPAGGGGGGGEPSMIFTEILEKDKTYNEPHYKQGWIYNTIGKVISYFGLELGSQRSDAGEVYRSHNSGVMEAYYNQDYEGNIKIDVLADRYKAYFENYNYYATKISTTPTGTPDYKKDVGEIISKIRENSTDEWPGYVGTYYESDLSIVEYWASDQFKDSFLFAGKGNKINPDSSVMIVGDRQLIRDYLYGNCESVTQQQIPMHHEDAKVLQGGSYRDRIREIIFPQNKIGPFGDISYIPEDFTFLDPDAIALAKSAGEKSNLTVLRYNTKNPNVMEINFKWAPVYLAALQAGFVKEISRKASTGIAAEIFPQYSELENPDYQKLIQYLIEEEIAMLSGDQTQQMSEAAALGGDVSPGSWGGHSAESAKLALASCYEFMTRVYPLIKIRQERPGDPAKIMSKFIKRMYRQAMFTDVTTLPLFHLSDYSTIGSQIALFAQDSPILQSKQARRTPLNAFYSGMYQIMGFEHSITHRGVDTKFELVKNFDKPYVPDQGKDELEVMFEELQETASQVLPEAGPLISLPTDYIP